MSEFSSWHKNADLQFLNFGQNSAARTAKRIDLNLFKLYLIIIISFRIVETKATVLKVPNVGEEKVTMDESNNDSCWR